jgi:hypothetical protein
LEEIPRMMDLLPPAFRHDTALYDYYYEETGKLNVMEHPLVKNQICRVLSINSRWLAVVAGQGTIGYFDSEREAKQRALWYVFNL